MEKTLYLTSDEEAIKLYGSLDKNLRFAEETFGVRTSARNHRLKISGSEEEVNRAVDFFMDQLNEIRQGEIKKDAETKVSHRSSGLMPKSSSEGSKSREGLTHSGQSAAEEEKTDFFHGGKIIRPKTKNQEAYIRAVKKNDIVVSIGPAGTGKTYLAVALALDFLKKKRVTRIILTRPAVETGESLGYLPGDLYAKINPYLRPLYDALYDMMDFEDVSRFIQRGVIEIAPLAYMRGRTLNDAFVILDEGQNTTHEQMKMFLTRLGPSSKAVITGDVTQIDLPNGKRSGLIEIQEVLKRVDGFRFCYLTEKDVVRHKLVQAIVKAYEKHSTKRETTRETLR